MHQPLAPAHAPLEIIENDISVAMADLERGSFDVILTSPPYWRPRKDCRDASPGEIGCENLLVGYIQNMGSIFRSLMPLLRKDGVLMVVIGDSPYADTLGAPFRLRSELAHLGFYTFQREIVLTGRSQETNNSQLDHEYVLCFSRTPTPLCFERLMELPSVMYPARGIAVKGSSHLMTPVPVVEQLLTTTCVRRPSRVLDPFAGIGTVGHIAVDLGHEAVCVEKSAKNCEIMRGIANGEKVTFLTK